jgi:hypothetical protein
MAIDFFRKSFMFISSLKCYSRGQSCRRKPVDGVFEVAMAEINDGGSNVKSYQNYREKLFYSHISPQKGISLSSKSSSA